MRLPRPPGGGLAMTGWTGARPAPSLRLPAACILHSLRAMLPAMGTGHMADDGIPVRRENRRATPKEKSGMKSLTAFVLPALGLILSACAGPRVQEFSVTAVDLAFQPTTLEVTAGMPVRLTMINEGALDHDFSILEIPMETTGATAVAMPGHDMGAMTVDPQLHMAVTMGMSNTIEFTPTKPGTYEFFCTVAGHKEAGMMGRLVVKAP